jgi:hypothetical protein
MKLHHINQYECISKASNIDVNFIREQASKQTKQQRSSAYGREKGGEEAKAEHDILYLNGAEDFSVWGSGSVCRENSRWGGLVWNTEY